MSNKIAGRCRPIESEKIYKFSFFLNFALQTSTTASLSQNAKPGAQKRPGKPARPNISGKRDLLL